MNFVISEGNVDTEGSGLAQQFATPSGSSSFGNFDSERLSNSPATHRGGFDLNQFLQSLGVRQSVPNRGYAQLGEAVQQMLQGAQQGGSMGLGGGGLTSGFDHNWLSRQTTTASADGKGI